MKCGRRRVSDFGRHYHSLCDAEMLRHWQRGEMKDELRISSRWSEVKTRITARGSTRITRLSRMSRLTNRACVEPDAIVVGLKTGVNR